MSNSSGIVVPRTYPSSIQKDVETIGNTLLESLVLIRGAAWAQLTQCDRPRALVTHGQYILYHKNHWEKSIGHILSDFECFLIEEWEGETEGRAEEVTEKNKGGKTPCSSLLLEENLFNSSLLQL